MNQITKNFSITEFACNDGTQVPLDKVCNVITLAKQLQVLRDELKEPLIILSGYRSPAWNKKVGGVKNSMHLEAKASDLTTKSNTPAQLKARILKLIKEGKMQDGGIGLYRGFVHYDIGPVRRWFG